MSAVLARSAVATAQPLALIVDDSPFLAVHLGRLLEALGLQARTPSAPAELCALSAEAAIIFVELELFQGSGFEVTRELAARCACPLVLLTGTGRNTDLQWGLRAGASAVLPRPVTARALRTTLDRLGNGGLHE
jgi:CheY-like chemotaxis protein